MKSGFITSSLAGAALALGLVSGVNAAVFNKVDAAASHVKFGYTQMNVGLEGSFNKIEPKVFSFDPAAPEAAKVDIEVPMVSVDSGSEEANAELVKPEWLASQTHAAARFVSKSVKALGDGRYQVEGDLTIKGKTLPVSMPVTFKEEAGKGVFEGGFTFKRTDFGIGEGPWGDTSIVADDVSISFHVVAAP